MSSLSFAVTHHTAEPAAHLWSRLGRGDTDGWPVLQECHRLELGAPVLFTMPSPDGSIVQASGRIDSISDGLEVGVRQEAPWRGSIRMRLQPTDDGTDVKLFVTIGEECLAWFGAGPTAAPDPRPSGSTPDRDRLRIGLLVCLSGQAGIFGRSVVNAAELAVDDLNRSGAFGRRTAELVVADDRTSPEAARAAFTRLTRDDGCDVVVATVSSASGRAIQPLARRTGSLVLNAALSESGTHDDTFVRLGETPADQLLHSVPTVMSSTGARSWFILGSDYVWPRAMGAVARRVIGANAGRVAGEHYAPMGTTDFARVIETISRSGADVVLSSLVGLDAVRFERAFHASGSRSSITTLATIMDDAVREHIGSEASEGIWSVQDYFATPGADALARRYDARFGVLAPRLTSMAKSTHDAIGLYAEAVTRAGSTAPRDVVQQITGGSIGSERLRRRLRGHLTPTPIAIATAHGFDRVSSA